MTKQGMTDLTRRSLMGGAASTLALRASGLSAADVCCQSLIFSYFSGGKDETPGLRLAASDDGLTFRPLGGGAIVLVPEVGESKLMRDPFLMRGPFPGDPWHLLWTTAWEGITLGHATSHDLVNWSKQTAIPVMAGIEGTRNVWAPEMIWDPVAQEFTLFWSSTVTGRFSDEAGKSEDGYNHRLWCVTTRDFVTFSPARVLWDPGYSVIDATFARHPSLGLHLIFKDERLVPRRKYLRIARAASPIGPFANVSEQFSPDWVEGPTAIVIGEWTYVYYDRYRDGSWGAVRSRDLKSWENISSRINFPQGARHGTVVRADAELVRGFT